MGKRLVVLAALAASIFGSSVAHAGIGESTRGPFYVQGTIPFGFNYWGVGGFGGCGRFGFGCGGWSSWRPDVEFGIHFNGRHDGFVLGFRQAFLFTALPDNVGGTTVVKLGYDIAIPIKKYELVIGPYATVGIGYAFSGGGNIGFQTGFFGADVKFFIIKGFYAFGRPPEFGMQCFHSPSTNCWFQTIFGAGVGYAFPSPGG